MRAEDLASLVTMGWATGAETLICCWGAEGRATVRCSGRVRWTSGSVPARTGAAGRGGGGGKVGIGVTRGRSGAVGAGA